MDSQLAGAPGAPARLSAARLVAYAAPTVALQAMMVPMLMYLPPAFSEAAGLSLVIVTAMFAIGRAFEAVTDPLIGALSDRTVSRFGRRRVWMVAGVPLALLGAWFLLTPNAGTGAFYLLVWLLVFYAGWTMVFIPHQTWGGELSTNYDERTRIAGFRETGSFLGYLLAALIPLIYLQYILNIEAPPLLQIVQTIGVFFAIALPIGVLLCFARVPAVAQRSGEHAASWSELFAILKRNAPFRRLVIAYLIDRISMGAYFLAQPLLITAALGMPQHVLWVALANGVSSVVLAPLWVPIATRIGKHRAYCLGNLITIASYLMLFVAEPGQLAVVMAAMVVMALGNAGTMITPPAMAADAVDHDELQSGVSQMGGHMAFVAFAFKAGMACGPLVGGLVLKYYGFDQAGQALDASSTLGIRLCASVLPAVLLLIPIAMMWRYPIDTARHAQIRAELDRKRAATALA